MEPSIATESIDGAAIVVMRGEHDLATAPALQAELDRQLAGDASIVVDLSETTFVDSSVMRVLLVARDRAEAAGNRLLIVLPSSASVGVRRPFEVSGLIQLLDVHDDRKAAIAAAG